MHDFFRALERPYLLEFLIVASLTLSFAMSVIEYAFGAYSWPRIESTYPERGELERLKEVLYQRDDILAIASFLTYLCVLAFSFFLSLEILLDELDFHAVWVVALAVFASSCAVFFVSNVLARTIGEKKAERIAIAVGPFFKLLARRTPLAVLPRLSGVAERLASGFSRTGEDAAAREELADDLVGLVSDRESEGHDLAVERGMIENIIELGEQDVSEVMTPRAHIEMISAETTLRKARQYAAEVGRSRIPIFQKTRDNIIGILYAKDLLKISDDDLGNPVTSLMRAPYFVPEMKKLRPLLNELRAKRIHIAIVLDEYGGTAGLITFEDIVVEIFGEMPDEYEQRKSEPCRLISDDVIIVDGLYRVDDLNEIFRVEIEKGDCETVGGFVMSALEMVPPPGTAFRRQNLNFTILESDERRVLKVKVERVENGQNGA